MASVSIEEERFREYLRYSKQPGLIIHTPHGDTSYLAMVPAPYDPALRVFMIVLPYKWSDQRRIHETAMYIARIELGMWQYSPLDLIVNPADMVRQATAQEIADFLIAPRPYVEDMLQQFGSSRETRKRIAHELTIPLKSVDTVLRVLSSPSADTVHRHIREVTGYPWFLPTHLRDAYPPDRW